MNQEGGGQLAYVSARITKRERVRLDEIAVATDRTPSAIVRRALRVYIDHLEDAERILSGEPASTESEREVA